MGTRTPGWRTGAGILAWILIAVATAALAWTAVGVVVRDGDESADLSVPSEALVDRSASPSGSAGTPSSGQQAPTDDPTAGTDDPTARSDDPTAGIDDASSHQSLLIPTRGGEVSVSCTGSGAIKLGFATPANGWQDELDDDQVDGTDDEVEVTFVRGDEEEIRVRARCHDGSVEYDLSD